MKHLIIMNEEEHAFITDWYDFENCYSEGQTIINLSKMLISYNGIDFHEIEEDHL